MTTKAKTNGKSTTPDTAPALAPATDETPAEREARLRPPAVAAWEGWWTARAHAEE